MILTGVTEAINQAQDLEDLKKVLTMVTHGVNTLSDSSVFQRGDLQFLDQGKGPVFRRDDGHYIRVGVGGTGSSTITYTDLGTTLPNRG